MKTGTLLETTQMSTNNRYYVDMKARFLAFQNGEIDLRNLHPIVYEPNNVALALRQLSHSGGRDSQGPDGTNIQCLNRSSLKMEYMRPFKPPVATRY